MRGLRDQYNGFWIGWLDLFSLPLQLQSIKQLTINDCLRLTPFLTGLRVSTLLLWLTWLWFTNRSLLLCLPRTMTVLRMNSSSMHCSLYSLACMHKKCLLLARIHRNCLLTPLTWKMRSVPSLSPRIRISIERVLTSRFLAICYSCFEG
jgi:hypothetical protein